MSSLALATVVRPAGCTTLPGAAGDAGLSTPLPALTPAAAIQDDGNYMLPWRDGEAFWVAQGSFGVANLGSHAGQYAIDFVMPEGTAILAARAGRVIAVREDCPNMNCPFSPETCCGNYLKIAHADGTISAYWHLPEGGSCVTVGEEVQRGDVLGFSGNTGQSLSPHLHFSVFAPQGGKGTGRYGESNDGSMEVAFAEVPGDGLPRLLGTYTSGNRVNRDECSEAAGSP